MGATAAYTQEANRRRTSFDGSSKPGMWWIAATPLAPVGAAGARHTPRSRAPRAPRRSSCPRGRRRSSCAPCHSVKVSAVNPRSAMPRRSGMAAARIQRSSSVSASMSAEDGSCSRCRASRRCAYWYNQAHLHSALGHVPPLEFERAHGRQVTPAQQPVARRTGPLLNPRAVQDAAITSPSSRSPAEPSTPGDVPPEIVDGFCRCRRGSTSNMSWSRHSPTSSGTGNGQRRAGSPSKDRSIALYLLL